MAATTTSRAARVMTEADKRLQDSGFDGPQSRAVILTAAQISDESIRDAIRPLATKKDLDEANRRLAKVEEDVSALQKDVSALHKEVAAVREATNALTDEIGRFRDRTTAEMAMGFARMSRQLWIMAIGAVGTTAAITFGIVRLLL